MENWEFFVILFLLASMGSVISVLMLRLMYASMKNDFEILYQLGMSHKDKKQVCRWIVFYMSRFALPLGLLGAMLFSYLLCLCIPSMTLHIPILLCCLITLFLLFLCYVIIVYSRRKQKERRMKKKHPYIKNSYRRFQVVTYTLRMIQVHKFTFLMYIILNLLMVSGIGYCCFHQILLNERCKIELQREQVYDYALSFKNPYEHSESPYGVIPFDISQLRKIEGIEEVVTIKENDVNYHFAGQEKSEAWNSYQAYLEKMQKYGIDDRHAPYILGINENEMTKDVIRSYDEKNEFWNSDAALFKQLYFSWNYDEERDLLEAGFFKTKEQTLANYENYFYETKLENNSIVTMPNQKEFHILAMLKDFSFEQHFKGINLEPYSIVVRDSSFQKVMPKHINVQYLYIKTNDKADFVTDGQIMNVLSKYTDASIENRRLHKESIRQERAKGMLFYSMIEIVILFTWFLMMLRYRNLRIDLLQHTSRILNHLGVTHRFFVKSSLLESTMVLLLNTIPAIYCFTIMKQHMSFEIHDTNEVYMLQQFLGDYALLIGVGSGLLILLWYLSDIRLMVKKV